MLINCTVRSYWNLLENVLITATDITAPLMNYNQCKLTKNQRNFIPPNIVTKLNKRKRLIKLDQLRKSNTHLNETKQLSMEIKSYFKTSKAMRVVRFAMESDLTTICGRL